jgi:hypothetical protein
MQALAQCYVMLALNTDRLKLYEYKDTIHCSFLLFRFALNFFLYFVFSFCTKSRFSSYFVCAQLLDILLH